METTGNLTGNNRRQIMGYTHYMYTKPSISEDKWLTFAKAMRILVAKESDTIQREFNDKRKPLINAEEIWFNGIEDDGHETFVINRVSIAQVLGVEEKIFNFCKTARKPYDVFVVASLLLAKLYLKDEIRLSSDGDMSDWQAGVELVNSKVGKKCGFEIEFTGDDPETAVVIKKKLEEIS